MRVRYMVNHIDSAVSFYTSYLGFSVKTRRYTQLRDALPRKPELSAQHAVRTRGSRETDV